MVGGQQEGRVAGTKSARRRVIGNENNKQSALLATVSTLAFALRGPGSHVRDVYREMT